MAFKLCTLNTQIPLTFVLEKDTLTKKRTPSVTPNINVNEYKNK